MSAKQPKAPVGNTLLMGTLEIDHNRGVIYFHLSNAEEVQKRSMATPLRISQLPKPIPALVDGNSLDITFGHGVSWSHEEER